MNLDGEDRIVAVAKLAEQDEETENELAKDDGGPVAAELELAAAEPDERRGSRRGRLQRRRSRGRDLDDTADEAPEADDDEEPVELRSTRKESRTMQFFLDTAEIKEIETGLEWGMVDGITTNPSLIAKSGRPYLATVQEIAQPGARPGLRRGAGHRVRRDPGARAAGSPAWPTTWWSRCRSPRPACAPSRPSRARASAPTSRSASRPPRRCSPPRPAPPTSRPSSAGSTTSARTAWS